MKAYQSVVTGIGLAVSLAAPAAWSQVGGALYTTLSNGLEVNFNIYASKEDVYINGGPGKGAPSNDPGLVPDGIYVFMVTDPSGKTILSEDPAQCRQVRVEGGRIVGIVAAGGCEHDPGTFTADGITVQLMPYSDTPNPGGEYKVWITPLTSFTCSLTAAPPDTNCTSGKHGFLSSASKTDNFKVGGAPHEIDTRFFDTSGRILDNRKIIWYDTHGASNTKWSYYAPQLVIMHEAHVEAPELGLHYIQILNQPGCTVGDVYVAGSKTQKKGPQTVPVRVTKTMLNKLGRETIFVDVVCTSTN